MRSISQEAEAPIVLNLATDAELLKEYVVESREHLGNIEQGALILEKHPDDAETLHSVFRSFHTFKGGAGFLNLVPISQLAHGLESLLDLARQRKLSLDAGHIGLILRGRDTLKQFVDQIDAQLSGATPPATILIPTGEFCREIQDAMTGERHTATVNQTPEPASAIASSASATVKVETAKLDSLVDMVGELVIAESLVAHS